MRTNRIFVAMCIFLAVYVLLGGKIAYYQLWCGSELTQEAAAMRNKQIQLKEYSRGEILDRNLVSLTSTNSSNGLYCLIDNHYSESPEESISELTDALARVFAEKDINTSQWAAELMCAYQMGKPYIRIAADLTDEEILRIESLQAPGLVVAPVIKRYGSDGFCAHLLGYVSKSEIAQGQAGIEREYDEILREGNAGQELVTVFDARGMAISGLMFKVKEDPKQKSNMVVLTIDKRVQEIVEKVMNEQVETGAVVVMDTKSREILAMASRPTFNPYQVENFLADKNRALSNRALNRYYPGSLFKIVVAAAALEENLVSPSDHFFCNGQYIFNEDLAISCWNKEGHGEINFVQAFAQSCNPSFINLGIKLGRAKIMDYAAKLHVTDESLIGYSYNAKSHVSINPGEPAIGNACLGQQGVLITPLQLASLISTVAEEGLFGPPRIIKYVVDETGQQEAPQMQESQQVISRETARVLKKLMTAAVTEGTGKTARLQEVSVAGKTATSQTEIFLDQDQELLNTWFGGFFPADNPRWAIVVLVENGKSGAASAAPVFKEIAREMLNLFPLTTN